MHQSNNFHKPTAANVSYISKGERAFASAYCCTHTHRNYHRAHHQAAALHIWPICPSDRPFRSRAKKKKQASIHIFLECAIPGRCLECGLPLCIAQHLASSKVPQTPPQPPYQREKAKERGRRKMRAREWAPRARPSVGRSLYRGRSVRREERRQAAPRAKVPVCFWCRCRRRPVFRVFFVRRREKTRPNAAAAHGQTTSTAGQMTLIVSCIFFCTQRRDPWCSSECPARPLRGLVGRLRTLGGSRQNFLLRSRLLLMMLGFRVFEML